MEVFLDTETTGLSHDKGARIVELTIIDENSQVLIDTLIDPKSRIPKHATAVHGITDEMVSGKPTIYQLIPKIKKAIAGNDVIIYNAPFDVQFIPGKLVDAANIYCAMRTFAEFKKSKKPFSLSNAAKIVGHQWQSAAHRALADTQATKSVWDATREAREAGELSSARPPEASIELEYSDEVEEWAAISFRRLIKKFEKEEIKKTELLNVFVSEILFSAHFSDDLSFEEMEKVITKSQKRVKSTLTRNKET